MYNNPYSQNYISQPNIDRINAQISELEKMKEQIQKPIQPTNLTQNFQLAPTRDFMRYANSIDEVQRENVTGDTPYFSKDMSVVWIKNSKGEIKAYELEEIIQKDEKDMQIELLIAEINELKGMIKNEQSSSNVVQSETTTDTTEYDEPVRTAVKKNKSTSVSRVSKSKTE